MTDKGPNDLAALAAELAAANAELAEAKLAESAARSRECAALNCVNGLQKKFDAMAAGIRNSAPHDTDWGRAKHDK